MKLTALLGPSMLVSTALTLPAQWVEVGDAAPLPYRAQVPIGTGPLTSITGSLNNDADMYLIRIDSPMAFVASTVGGAGFDTQLFLFRLDGQGVVHDDDIAGAFQSQITGVFVPSPGVYCLAVTAYDLDPEGQGKYLWNDAPFAVEHPPDGAGRLEAVDRWTGTSFASGAYTITLAGCSFPEKELVLPDNHHLTESPNQVGGTGSTAWWRTGGGRFQILYEGSHFISAGVTGPILINKIAFRGEDGEPNLGGQLWANVMVQLASTSLTTATMSNMFGLNQLPPPPDVTVLGPLGVFQHVPVWQAIGSHPNNTNIYLDLTTVGAVYLHDPTTPTPNLLIDVTLPSPAWVPAGVGPVMQMQNTSGSPLFIRGAGVTTPTPASPTGVYSNVPLTVDVVFSGPGGTPKIIPAINEFYGNGCGGRPSSFYQAFRSGEVFDLTGLTLTPSAVVPRTYTVTPGALPFDATKVKPVPSSIADEGTVAHPLGFTFAYPGGTTTAISACTNGYVWLTGAAAKTDSTPTVGELLGVTANDPPRLAPCWYDFHAGQNMPTHPNSGLHVLTDTSGGPGNYVCYVTWFNVGIADSVSGAGIGGHAVHDMQLVLYEQTGIVEFRYGAMPLYCSNHGSANPSHTAIVGFSRGRIGGVTPSVDPQSRDLSLELPFATAIEGAAGNIGLTAVAAPVPSGIAYGGRMFPGQSVTYNVTGVPPTAIIGAQLVDLLASRPGVNVPMLAPGCVVSTSLAPSTLEFLFTPGPNVSGAVPFFVPPGYSGLGIISQFVVLDASGVVYSSNAVRHTIGLY